MKRKLDDYASDAEFRFWGIVISRFVWDYSRSEVARKFNCSEPYITQVMNKFNEDGGYIDNRQYNGGNNRKVTEDTKRKIVNEYKLNPSSSSGAIVKKIEPNVTERTIRRIRVELGFVPIKPSELPALTNDNKKSRLKYCKEHKDDKFSNVCFSDESVFQLQANNKVIWYRKWQEPKPIVSVPQQNKKIMVWGGISRRGKTPLHIYRLDKKETVNRYTYMDCLEGNLVEQMNSKYGKGLWRYLQDNARPHTAEETLKFLEEQKIRLVEHPPYSPDLNPIEQIWAWMKQDICASTYETINDLIQKVQEKWDDLTIYYQNKVIDHHLTVIQEVLEAKGAYS